MTTSTACGIALAGAGDRLGIEVQDLLQAVAQRLADADRLAAKPRREAAQRLALHDLRAGQAGACREAVLHGVGDQLRPALAPQVGGDLGAVGVADQPAHLLRALGDAPVHLAGAEHGMRRAALGCAAVDVSGLGQVAR